MHFTSTVLSAAALVAQVAGHGAVTSYVIGGTTYPGYVSSLIFPYLNTLCLWKT